MILRTFRVFSQIWQDMFSLFFCLLPIALFQRPPQRQSIPNKFSILNFFSNFKENFQIPPTWLHQTLFSFSESPSKFKPPNLISQIFTLSVFYDFFLFLPLLHFSPSRQPFPFPLFLGFSLSFCFMTNPFFPFPWRFELCDFEKKTKAFPTYPAFWRKQAFPFPPSVSLSLSLAILRRKPSSAASCSRLQQRYLGTTFSSAPRFVFEILQHPVAHVLNVPWVPATLIHVLNVPACTLYIRGTIMVWFKPMLGVLPLATSEAAFFSQIKVLSDPHFPSIISTERRA